MKKFAFIFLALLLPVSLFAQDGDNASIPQSRNCSTMEVLDRLMKEDPGYQERLNQIELQVQDYLKSNPERDNLIINIPVVVHVVYRTTAQNISTSQIQSQINVLNADFRKLNSDVSGVPQAFAGLATDCQINFCLATRDPNGAVTTGITRTKTTKTSFSTNDYVKKTSRGGKDPWPASSYLNIWVCNLSGGVLGYAQFPGGSATTDGVVIGYKYFGTTGAATYPFNLGRTATHEVGHWLNLRHIWGDDGTGCTGSDLVSDTPNQGGYNFGCPSFPKVSCSNGPNGDLFMNYMDYSDDRCMFMFTTGQSGRMNATISGTRASLLSSSGCAAPIVEDQEATNDNISLSPDKFVLNQNHPNPFNPTTSISFNLPAAGQVSLKVFDISGKEVAGLVDNYLEAGRHSINFDASALSSGVYYYKLASGNNVSMRKMLLIK
ncbi:MAG: T9SS type A sorting domain-containing protein [Ignavibacteria bacterium]|nr:T9SS type A sorting domain-containing protein [Ignavibacteria bacterium]